MAAAATPTSFLIHLKPQHPVPERISKLYDDESTSDTIFLVGRNGKKIFAHRAILSAASEVFKAHFSSDWKYMNMIGLADEEEEEFRVILFYVYTEEIKFDTEILTQVLLVAHRFQIKGILDTFIKGVTFDNKGDTFHTQHCLWKYLKFGMTVNDEHLVSKCLAVMHNNMHALCNLPDYKEVGDKLVKYFAGFNLIPRTEITLMNALLMFARCQTQFTRSFPSSWPPIPEKMRCSRDDYNDDIFDRFVILEFCHRMHFVSVMKKRDSVDGLKNQSLSIDEKKELKLKGLLQEAVSVITKRKVGNDTDDDDEMGEGTPLSFNQPD